ncbi:MAG: type II secretion system protein [Synergistaceae bacterium]|nr:type II secretion system protein [Synergistaceae bacterium]MBR0256812.1 type II secretion system protein [Synergistaceae bacterium]
MTRKRRGFTLLEMLIAIAVLGILSAVTLFSTLNMTASAEANNVITNMMHLKTAVLMWYKENSSRVTSSYQIKTGTTTPQTLSNFFRDHRDEILKYLDNKTSLTITGGSGNTGDYSLFSASNTSQWYVIYNLGPRKYSSDKEDKEDASDMEAPNMRIREKLAGNAKTYGLSGKNSDGTLNSVYTNEQFVYMLIIDFNK